MTTDVPDGTAPKTLEEVRGREAARSAQLARRGHLLRLWRPPLQPGEWRTLGLFAADGPDQPDAALTAGPADHSRSGD
jgi:muconolactone D-isomerase